MVAAYGGGEPPPPAFGTTTAMDVIAAHGAAQKALIASTGRLSDDVLFGPCTVERAPAGLGAGALAGERAEMVITPLVLALFAARDRRELCRVPLQRVVTAAAARGGGIALSVLPAAEIGGVPPAADTMLLRIAPHDAALRCLRDAMAVHHAHRPPLSPPAPPDDAAEPPSPPAGAAAAPDAGAPPRPERRVSTARGSAGIGSPAPRPPAPFSSMSRDEILEWYRGEVRHGDEAGVQEEYAALLAERKLRDPGYTALLAESLCTVAEAAGDNKEDWDLDLADARIREAVADYWLHPPRCALLRRARERDPDLTRVDLSGTGADRDIVDEVLDILRCGGPVTELILHDNPSVGDEAVAAVCAALYPPPPAPTPSSVMRLDLRRCGVGVEGARVLCASAAAHPPLTQVLLDGCPVEADDPALVSQLHGTLALNLVSAHCPAAPTA